MSKSKEKKTLEATAKAFLLASKLEVKFDGNHKNIVDLLQKNNNFLASNNKTQLIENFLQKINQPKNELEFKSLNKDEIDIIKSALLSVIDNQVYKNPQSESGSVIYFSSFIASVEHLIDPDNRKIMKEEYSGLMKDIDEEDAKAILDEKQFLNGNYLKKILTAALTASKIEDQEEEIKSKASQNNEGEAELEVEAREDSQNKGPEKKSQPEPKVDPKPEQPGSPSLNVPQEEISKVLQDCEDKDFLLSAGSDKNYSLILRKDNDGTKQIISVNLPINKLTENLGSTGFAEYKDVNILKSTFSLSQDSPKAYSIDKSNAQYSPKWEINSPNSNGSPESPESPTRRLNNQFPEIPLINADGKAVNSSSITMKGYNINITSLNVEDGMESAFKIKPKNAQGYKIEVICRKGQEPEIVYLDSQNKKVELKTISADISSELQKFNINVNSITLDSNLQNVKNSEIKSLSGSPAQTPSPWVNNPIASQLVKKNSLMAAI